LASPGFDSIRPLPLIPIPACTASPGPRSGTALANATPPRHGVTIASVDRLMVNARSLGRSFGMSLYRQILNSTMYRLFHTGIWLLFAAPHCVLLAISKERDVLKRDIDRWLRHPALGGDLQKTFTTVRQDQRFAGFSLVTIFPWLLWHFPEFRSLFYHRISSAGHLASRILLVPSRWLLKPQVNLYIRCPSIGPGLYIQHGFSTVINARSLGENCWINQQVTVGSDKDQSPVIGNNVRICAGAVVIGDIHVGDNVVVGANSLLCKSTPANCVVAGVPAMIISRDGKKVRIPL
jgi:serine O-acetyltransferase